MRGYVLEDVLGKRCDEVITCLEGKGLDATLLAMLAYKLIDHDWRTQRFSEKRRHTSREYLEILRAVADCVVGDGAGSLAELHVALGLASKLRLYEYGDVDRFPQRNRVFGAEWKS